MHRQLGIARSLAPPLIQSNNFFHLIDVFPQAPRAVVHHRSCASPLSRSLEHTSILISFSLSNALQPALLFGPHLFKRIHSTHHLLFATGMRPLFQYQSTPCHSPNDYFLGTKHFLEVNHPKSIANTKSDFARSID
jgi:hypothetical protein